MFDSSLRHQWNPQVGPASIERGFFVGRSQANFLRCTHSLAAVVTEIKRLSYGLTLSAQTRVHCRIAAIAPAAHSDSVTPRG